MDISEDVYQKAKKALKKWGPKAQPGMAVGEIGELLELYGKEVQGRADPEDWADEIADVYVILPALVMVHSDKESVENRVEEKLDRLKEIIDEKADHPHNNDD